MRWLFVSALACLALPLAAVGQEPAGFQREAIHFTSGRFELAGDLIMPPGAGPHPVIVYVWGAGPSNREAHIANSPVLRTFLEHGFAVLLYDKPESGGSTGEVDGSRLFAEHAAILLDAVALLKRHAAIDTSAIGLYGSSQASYIMATAFPQTLDLAFVIAWSCPMESSLEQGAYLVGHYVRCAGEPEAAAVAAELAYRQRGSARNYAEYRAAAQLLEDTPAIRDGLGWAGVLAESDFAPADSSAEAFFDPGPAFLALRAPLLALYAENDRQIDPLQGANVMRRRPAAANDSLSAVVIVPGADHNMIVSPRGCMQDQREGYRAIGGRTLSPVFVDAIAAWLDRLQGERSRRPGLR